MSKKKTVHIDHSVIIITGILLVVGLLSLFSALMGTPSSYVYSNLLVQIIGIILGCMCVYAAIHVKQLDYRCLYKKHYAVFLFFTAIIFQLLVFTPLGITKNGASRWVDLGMISVQPSELLRITMILMLASLLVGYRKKIQNFKTIIFISLGTVGVLSLIMLLIRDKGTLIISGLAVLAMFLVSRVRLWHMLILVLIGGTSLIGFIVLSGGESYAENRIVSFLGLNPNPLGQDYQINQSIITIGSGQLMGKGLGNSIQKYEYLPEPLTDSIFAVYAEEWGFVGSCILLVLYLLFYLFALIVARDARDDYGRYITVGLATLITGQSLFNIMALVKLVPLSGMPLVFISKGGTSILTSLLAVAIIVNVSRIAKNGRKVKSAGVLL